WISTSKHYFLQTERRRWEAATWAAPCDSILRRKGSQQRSYRIHKRLLVKLINKAVLFELPDNAVIDQLFNPQARSGLAGKGFLDLHFATFSRHQRHSVMP